MATMSADAAALEKSRIRARARASRAARVAGDADGSSRLGIGDEMSRRVVEELAARGLLTTGGAIAVFVSTDAEPSTSALRAALRDAGATVLIPRVVGTALEWCVDDDVTSLAVSAWGIPEPTNAAVAPGVEPLATSAAVVLPALAVDERGYRVGQGGGFYDRALAQLDPGARPLLIGLVFDDELIAEAPHEAHDIRVDLVITERRVVTTAR